MVLAGAERPRTCQLSIIAVNSGSWRLGRQARALDPAVPQAAQPGCCLGKLGVGGARPDLGPAAVVAWVAAEELHVRADPAQAHQRLAYPRVIEVPLAVDRETVLAEPVAGGARLDPGEVDAAHGELGKQFHQRTGVVLAQEGDQRGPV